MQRIAVACFIVLVAVGIMMMGPVALPGTDIVGAADDHDDRDQGSTADHSQDDHNPIDNITGSPTPEPTPTETPTSTDDGPPTSTDDGPPGETPEGTPDDPSDPPQTPSEDSEAANTSLEVVDAEVLSDWVREGQEATVRATVENSGDERVTESLEVTVDGEQVAEPEVTVNGGETATVDFDVAFDEGGTVAVEGVQAGEVSIGNGSDELTEPQRPDEEAGNVPEPQPGFDAVAALAALLAAALVAWHRSLRR